jgi:hypothetical protein
MLGFDKNKMTSDYGTSLIKYGQTESKRNPNNDPNWKHRSPTSKDIGYKGTRPYEISGGYHSLFVYSDKIQPSFVGDSYTQLLRLVEIPSNAKYGDQVLITYPNSYYVPLLVKEFDTIEIDIKDSTGESIPFEFGRSIVVLHFRKIYKKG